MATFPAYAKIAENYEEQRGKNGVIRSTVESGPPKHRRTQTRLMVTRPLTLYIETKANYLLWVDWVKTTLQSGNDWFTWTDPVDGVAKQGRILNGEYTAKPAGGMRLWTITLTLETWE